MRRDDPRPAVWVLLKEQNNDTSVHSVHLDRESLDARVKLIGERNVQYSLEKLGADAWRIGPDEDEGFFGNKPVRLQAVRAPLTSNGWRIVRFDPTTVEQGPLIITEEWKPQ